MAREGIDFFPFNCRLDEKFELIEAEYGLKGFAIVVKLLQRIYGEHGYYCEWNEDISFLFARQMGLLNGEGKNLIADVVKASVRRGIFDKGLFEKCGILTSCGIQKRYLDITYKRKEVILKKEYLLLSDGQIKGNVVILRDSVDRNQKNDDRSKQSKVKESKGNETKKHTITYVPDERLNRAIIDFKEYRKSINKPMGDRAVKLLISQLEKLSRNIEEQIEILNQSILNGWQGVFPLKKYDQNKRAETKNKNQFHNFDQRDTDYDAMLLEQWKEG